MGSCQSTSFCAPCDIIWSLSEQPIWVRLRGTSGPALKAMICGRSEGQQGKRPCLCCCVADPEEVKEGQQGGKGSNPRRCPFPLLQPLQAEEGKRWESKVRMVRVVVGAGGGRGRWEKGIGSQPPQVSDSWLGPSQTVGRCIEWVPNVWAVLLASKFGF